MRVIFFTKYTPQGASSRLRTYQYLDYFQRHGVECTVCPFFDNEYLKEVYEYKTHNKWKAFKSFGRRVSQLLTVFKYDKVVVEKELFPYFPAIAEWILYKLKVSYIVDYDDAIWHNYDLSKKWLIRYLLSRKIEYVMRYASCVVAGNDYIMKKAKDSGATHIELIPTVVDLNRYDVKKEFSKNILTIGWIGSPITSKYLHALLPIFKPLLDNRLIRLRLIGADRTFFVPEQIEVIEWDEKTEANMISTFDIGIMPLEDSIWEKGKCGYKLIQYMACGIPVIGTPIGVNDTLIREGWNGWKALDLDDWKRVLENSLVERKSLETLGQNGRYLVEQKYSLQVYAKRWLTLLSK
jgi:glycosyltransferase involved in cell wall biosynthesis